MSEKQKIDYLLNLLKNKRILKLNEPNNPFLSLVSIEEIDAQISVWEQRYKS